MAITIWPGLIGTRHWLARSLRRRMVRVLACVLVAVGLVGTWWEWQVWDVPDVGDPFDVTAAGTVRVPDDRNAFVRYQEAASLLVQFRGNRRSEQWAGPWSGASPAVRAWVDQNQEALEYWRDGTDRPEAVYHQPRDITGETMLPVTQALREFGHLASLHGSRLEEQGDMAGAWTWYRALLRSSRHDGSHGVMMERLGGTHLHELACRRLTRWAADPRTDAALLRRALDEVIAIDGMTPSVSESVRVEYVVMMNDLSEDLPTLASQAGQMTSRSRPDPWYFYVGPARTAMVAMTRDRERSRRVVRLFFANWLAHCDQPKRLRREAPDFTNRAPLIYLPDASSPPASRRLAPEAMVRAFESTMLARAILPTMDNFQRKIDHERAVQARLVVGLAEQLHRRERGVPPGSVEELVGPYLKRVPEAYRPEPPEPVVGLNLR